MTSRQIKAILFLVAWTVIPGSLAHITTRFTGLHGAELFAVGAVMLGPVGAVVNAIYGFAFRKRDLTLIYAALLGAASGLVTYPITWVILGGFSDWWPFEWPLLFGLVVAGLVLGFTLALLFFQARAGSPEASRS
jgi:hypothetical protein